MTILLVDKLFVDFKLQVASTKGVSLRRIVTLYTRRKTRESLDDIMRSRLSNRSVRHGGERHSLPCVVLRTAIGELDGSHGYIGSIGWKIPAERDLLARNILL